MEIKVKKWLFDILTAIENIEGYIGAEKLFEDYDSNSMLRDAVERNIEIIGEAVNKILQLQPEIEITDSRRIVDARNKIFTVMMKLKIPRFGGLSFFTCLF